MNVTVTTRQIEVKQFSLTLSAEDLLRYLDDPAAWAADMRAQLNGQLPAPLTAASAPPARPKKARAGGGGRSAGRGAHPKNRRASKKSGRPVSKRPASGQAKKAAQKPPKGSSLEPVECPICHAKIARKYLALHTAKKHGPASETTGT